jgi:hypothetical protein
MPSVILLMSVFAMTVGVASALFLQFARKPPSYALPGAIVGLIGGLGAIIAALATNMK